METNEILFILALIGATYYVAYRQAFRHGYEEGLHVGLEAFLETKKNLFEEEGDDDGN